MDVNTGTPRYNVTDKMFSIVTNTIQTNGRQHRDTSLQCNKQNVQYWNKDKKEEIWLSPMTKTPIPTEMSKGQSDNINNATKKFD